MPALYRQTLDFMTHNSDDTLKFKLSEEQKEDRARAERIRAEIFKRQIRSEWSEFSNREQHAIEIFLRSDCKNLTSGLPNIIGKWSAGVTFNPRRDAAGPDGQKKPLGGSKLKRVYDQVVTHPERVQRCQELKNAVGWTEPFNYSTLVANANAIAKKEPRVSKKKSREREYAWRKRRQQGKPVKNPSGSPYASEDEGSPPPQQPALARNNWRAPMQNWQKVASQTQAQLHTTMQNWQTQLAAEIGRRNAARSAAAQNMFDHSPAFEAWQRQQHRAAATQFPAASFPTFEAWQQQQQRAATAAAQFIPSFEQTQSPLPPSPRNMPSIVVPQFYNPALDPAYELIPPQFSFFEEWQQEQQRAAALKAAANKAAANERRKASADAADRRQAAAANKVAAERSRLQSLSLPFGVNSNKNLNSIVRKLAVERPLTRENVAHINTAVSRRRSPNSNARQASSSAAPSSPYGSVHHGAGINQELFRRSPSRNTQRQSPAVSYSAAPSSSYGSIQYGAGINKLLNKKNKV